LHIQASRNSENTVPLGRLSVVEASISPLLHFGEEAGG